MNIQDFITQDVLGVPIKVANWMCEEFGLDIDRNDIKCALMICSECEAHQEFFGEVGYWLMHMIYGRLLMNYDRVANRSDFKLFYDGDGTYITYKCKRIVSKDQLDKMTGVI